MIRRWTIRLFVDARPFGVPEEVDIWPTNRRFLTRYFAQQEANRLNAKITVRSPTDVLYRPAAIYSPGVFDRISAPYRSWRRTRFLARVAKSLRKAAP